MKETIKKSTIVIGITLLIVISWINDVWAYSSGFDKVIEIWQHFRQSFFISGLFLIGISVLLVCLKKISWFWIISLLGWWAAMGTRVVYSFCDFETPLFAFIVFSALILFLLPVGISLLQYKLKKINKKILKHRFFVFLTCCPLLISVLFLIFIIRDFL